MKIKINLTGEDADIDAIARIFLDWMDEQERESEKEEEVA